MRFGEAGAERTERAMGGDGVLEQGFADVDMILGDFRQAAGVNDVLAEDGDLLRQLDDLADEAVVSLV
jgi:hypothetical protein